MTSAWAGVGTVVLAAAISTSGLIVLSGTAPDTGGGSPDSGEPVETSATHDEPSTSSTSTSSAPTTDTTITPTPTTTTTTTTTPVTTTTTSTTATTPTTPITTTTTAITIAPVTPVPAWVAASDTVVGAGGTVTFDGECAAGAPEPVVVWIIGDAATEVVDIGGTASPWTYTWTAPDDENAASFTFQFWCGDPSGHDYPTDLQPTVAMVASSAPPSPAPAPSPPGPVLPETS